MHTLYLQLECYSKLLAGLVSICFLNPGSSSALSACNGVLGNCRQMEYGTYYALHLHAQNDFQRCAYFDTRCHL